MAGGTLCPGPGDSPSKVPTLGAKIGRGLLDSNKYVRGVVVLGTVGSEVRRQEHMNDPESLSVYQVTSAIYIGERSGRLMTEEDVAAG